MDNAAKKEFIEKVKKAKNAEELVSIAKENGIEVTEEAAQCYFCRQHREGELSDEKLKNVGGGESSGLLPVFTSGPHLPPLPGTWISQLCNNFVGVSQFKSCNHCVIRGIATQQDSDGNLICTMENHS